jgi:hypothetical protein
MRFTAMLLALAVGAPAFAQPERPPMAPRTVAVLPTGEFVVTLAAQDAGQPAAMIRGAYALRIRPRGKPGG